MTRTGIVAVGCILGFFGFMGLLVPVYNGRTITEISDLCKSGLGQIGQLFSQQIQQNCETANLLAVLIYALLGIGVILIIVGAVLSSNEKYETTHHDTR
jgi:hypothetical protein